MERIASSDAIVERPQVLNYSLFREQGSSGRLLVLFPGTGSNTGSIDRMMRRIKEKDFPSLHYDSITTSFPEKPLDLDGMIREFARVLSREQAEFDSTNVVLLGSCVGAGFVTRLAQYLYKNPDYKITLNALILLMPCIDQGSIKGNMLGVLKRLPRFMALGLMQMAYTAKDVVGHIVKDPFETTGSLVAKYSSFLAIPERSTDPIDPEIPVYVFLSEKDRYIDGKIVLARLKGSIAAGNVIKTQHVSPTGVNYHDFKPPELIDAAKTLFLPTFAKIWGQKTSA